MNKLIAALSTDFSVAVALQQKAAIHTSAELNRARRQFFNIHKKVSEPEKQEVEYFEKQAAKLPLDDHYVDALQKLYTDKIGSERELNVKADDSLVGRTGTPSTTSVDYGLPEIDVNAPRLAYAHVDALSNAPESVKRIFSIGYGRRRDLTDAWKAKLIQSVNRHKYDDSSLQSKIAWATALIRHWSELIDDIAKKTPKKPTWLTHRLWLMVDHRRKLLRQLREHDAEAFEEVIQKLQIAYHVTVEQVGPKTRKAWSESQLRVRVEAEKERKLKELHEEMKKDRDQKLNSLNEKLDKLAREEQSIKDRLTAIMELEGKSTENITSQGLRMRAFDCLERPLARAFFRYGAFVSKNPFPFVAFPLLIALATAVGFIHLDSVTDAIYLFTPEGAPSKMERQTIHDHWPLHNHNYIPGRAVTQLREIQLTVTAKDNGNVLEPQCSEAINRLDKYIQNRVKVDYDGVTYKYEDLCLRWRNEDCPGNKHVQILSELYNRGFNISYPTVRIGNVNGYIGSSLGGLSLSRISEKSEVVASARSWLMVYHLKFYPANDSLISGLWEKEFEKAMKEYPSDPYIDFTFFHSQTLAEELKRNSDSLIPRFVFSFTMLVVFSALCSMTTIGNTIYFDWVVSKPTLAVLGVINAGMGIVTSIGLLNFSGIPYCDIVGVMPFLVVAVGIDNMFLMLAAVRNTNRAHDTSVRIGEAMSDAAVSMLITSLTDAVSFGVGTITSIPAVRIFCIYTCLALALTYIYQITFFTGLLSIWIKWESENRHTVLLTPTIAADQMEKIPLYQRFLQMGTRADPDESNLKANVHYSSASAFFKEWFGPVLVHPVIRVLVGVWFCIYLGFSIYGCTQIREGLEPVNLLVEDSYAIPHYRSLEKYFWHYGAILQIVVNNPPDLRNRYERLRVDQMVHDFATTKHSIGDESVQFWLKEMQQYYTTELMWPEFRDAAIYKMAEHFFGVKGHDRWEHDVVWGEMSDGSIGITAFRFLIGLREISRTQQQQEATFVMRDVAARYPDYNVTTFMPLWLFTDQYALVIPNTIQNIVIALAVMIIIAIALIPQPMCAFWVAFAIGSIDVGVIGFMTLWGVNLDAISMITIIMSIGFSVDYAAHITYGYVSSKEPTAAARICAALGHLGWPLTQGALSTIIAVAVLAQVPAYMIITFFKTVFLAIVIGLLHGLVFLPVALSVFVRGSCILSDSTAISPIAAEKKPLSRRKLSSPTSSHLSSALSSKLTPSIALTSTGTSTTPSPRRQIV